MMIQTRLARALRDVVEPLISRPRYLQVAALCVRENEDRVDVLLVRSLGTGRWILPKGWPMDGKTLAEAALREAWEEAGVVGTVSEKAIGSYTYNKITDGGLELPTQVQVFPVIVKKLKKQFPESNRRKRKWIPAKHAAELVNEPALKELLASL